MIIWWVPLIVFFQDPIQVIDIQQFVLVPLFYTVLVVLVLFIVTWISRGVLRSIRKSFWKICPPRVLIGIQKYIWSPLHRLAQFIAYQGGGRAVYVFLFIITAELFILGQVLPASFPEMATTSVNGTYNLSNDTLQLFLTQSQNVSMLSQPVISSVNASYNITNNTALLILAQSQSGSTFSAVAAAVFSFDGLLRILVLYALILCVYWIWKYRSVLIIDDFDDWISAKDEYPGKGIAHLLLVELNRISRLYSDVSEQRPIVTSVGEARQLSAVLKVDDPGTSLNQAVAATSTVSIGSVTFPLGLFISLFNILGRGPRVRGSIRRGEGGTLILLASSTGFHRDFGWEVSSTIVPENHRLLFPDEKGTLYPKKKEEKNAAERDKKDQVTKIVVIKKDEKEAKTPEPGKAGNDKELSLEKMVGILACKIMTDIPSTGSFRWEATMLFNEGLRKYRECLQTPRDQTSHLKQAEECFQKALVFDKGFTTAWYNLGVVYSELGMKNAAETAFARVITFDQNQPGAYYGRALTRYFRCHWRLIDAADGTGSLPTTGEYQNEVLGYCDQAEELIRNTDRPFERVWYWLHGRMFPADYLSLLARCYHLEGMAYLDMAEITRVEMEAKRTGTLNADEHLKKARERAATAEKELTGATARDSAAGQRLKEAEEKVTAAGEELHRAKAGEASARADCSAAEKKAAKIARQLLKENNSRNTAEKGLNYAYGMHKSAEYRLKNAEDALTKARNSLTKTEAGTDLTDFTLKKIKKAESDFASAQSQFMKAEAQVEPLTAGISRIQKTIADLEAEERETEELYVKTKKEADQAKLRLDRAEADVQALNAQLSDAKDEDSEAKENVKDADTRVRKERHHLREAEARVFHAKEYLEKADAEYATAEKQEIQLLNEAVTCFNLATAAAWKSYYRFTQDGSDSSIYRKRHADDLCRFLHTCLSDLGWACTKYRVFYDSYAAERAPLQKGDSFPSPPDAGPIFQAALDLNPRLNSDAACAEPHARLGIWLLLTTSPENARARFQSAARINPGAMNYHLLSAVTACLDHDPSAKKLPCPINEAWLDLAIEAYKNQVNHRDAQWRYITDLRVLLEKHHLTYRGRLDGLFPRLETIRTFCGEYYCLEQLLDFYTTDFAKKSYDRQIEKIAKDMKDRYGLYTSLLNDGDPTRQWMHGQICYLEGRWRYYQADYGRWFDKAHQKKKFIVPAGIVSKASNHTGDHRCHNYSEELFRCSQDYFAKALHEFRNFPNERQKIFPRIALTQAIRCNHDYPASSYLSASARAINPVGDFERVIQGLQAIEFNDYEKAADHFSEALLRAYDLPEYTQYVVNQYYRKLAAAHYFLIETTEDERKLQDHCCTIIDTIDEALSTFEFSYQQYLSDEELGAAGMSPDGPSLLNLCYLPDLPCQSVQLPACVSGKSGDLNGRIVLKRHKATEYLHRIMAAHNIRGFYLDFRERYDEAMYEFTIINSFYRPPFLRPYSREHRDIQQPWPWLREYLISLHNLASVSLKRADYGKTLSFIRLILSYEDDLREFINDEPIWIKAWLHVTPFDILISAYLWTVRISLDIDGDSWDAVRMNKHLRDAWELLEEMKKLHCSPFNCNKVTWDVLELTLLQQKARLFVCLGMMNLRNLEGCPCDDPGKLPDKKAPKPATADREKNCYSAAFRCFDQAVRCGADASLFMDILKGLAGAIAKDPKQGRKELIAHAERYFELFKQMADSKKSGSFIEEFKETITAWKKPEEPAPGKRPAISHMRRSPAGMFGRKGT